MAPRSLEFGYTDFGKPFLPGGRLRFNISHSGVLMACAIASSTDIGVDIEAIRPVSEDGAIASRFFSRREIDALFRLHGSERAAAFFRCWTRKEAFLKATGEGLSGSLSSFSVSLGEGEEARFLSPPHVAAGWQLNSFDPAPGYAGAVSWKGQPARVATYVFAA